MKSLMKPLRITGLLFLLGLIILALSIWGFLSLPARRQEIASAEARLLLYRQKAEALSQFLSFAKSLKRDLTLVQAAIPPEEDVPTLMTQLEDLGKLSGMRVQYLGFGGSEKTKSPAGGKEVPSGELKEISLTVVATGPVASLSSFLSNLEQTSRIITVDSFRFSPLRGGQNTDELSATLGVKAYYLPVRESVAPEAPLTLDPSSSDYIEVMKKVKALKIYKAGE